MFKFVRYFFLASLVFAAGCVGFAATHAAGIRRQESWRLRTCVEYRCQWTQQCLQESAARCREQGLEASCGADELFTSAPIRCNP